MKLLFGQNIPRDDKKGYSKKLFLNETDLHVPGTLVQEVKVPAGESAEIHYHKIQTEIFYFFDEGVYRIVNGETIRPKKGDVLIIEPDDRHTLVNDTDKDYVYICFKVNYAPDDFYVD